MEPCTKAKGRLASSLAWEKRRWAKVGSERFRINDSEACSQKKEKRKRARLTVYPSAAGCFILSSSSSDTTSGTGGLNGSKGKKKEFTHQKYVSYPLLLTKEWTAVYYQHYPQISLFSLSLGLPF